MLTGPVEIPDGVFHLGVAAMVGLEFDHVAGTVGDERVIGVGGQQGQLGAGRGLDPAHDQPARLAVAGEGPIGDLGHLGAVGEVRDRHPRRLVDGGDGGVDSAFVQLGGDRVAHIGGPAGVDHFAAVETRVTPQGQRPGGARGPDPVEGLAQKAGCPPPRMGVAAPQAAAHHIGGAGHHGEERVIAPHVVVGEAGAALLVPARRSRQCWSPRRWSPDHRPGRRPPPRPGPTASPATWSSWRAWPQVKLLK